ncbi:MAG TPA: hypothetical protein VE010_02680, partial [Thermoanaerobaculia bacterium]|nr:hypothetical protein [Thermoanaerobaculia bacterium]
VSSSCQKECCTSPIAGLSHACHPQRDHMEELQNTGEVNAPRALCGTEELCRLAAPAPAARSTTVDLLRDDGHCHPARDARDRRRLHA